LLLYYAGLSYEKEITVNGTTIFIGGAVDIDDEKVIAVWYHLEEVVWKQRHFFGKVKYACKGRLPRIFVDGGKWYAWALVFRDGQ